MFNTKIPFNIEHYFNTAHMYDPKTRIVEFSIREVLQKEAGEAVTFDRWEYIDISANTDSDNRGNVFLRSLDVVVRGYFDHGYATFSMQSCGDSMLMMKNFDRFVVDTDW